MWLGYKKKAVRLKCRLCGNELRVDERPEGICDECLRKNISGPWSNPPEGEPIESTRGDDDA